MEEGPGEARTRGSKERKKDGQPAQSMARHGLSEEDLRLPIMEVEAPDGPPDIGILTGQFGTGHLDDLNFQAARVQVIAVDGVLLPGVSEWH